MAKNKCPCGFAQSSPIPHEHDQTEREKAIIKYFQGCCGDLLNALWEVLGDAEDEIPLYLLSKNGKKARDTIIKAGGNL